MTRLKLETVFQAAIEKILDSELEDPIKLIESTNLSKSTFFENAYFSDLDFRSSNLRGVSFRGARLERLKMYRDQEIKMVGQGALLKDCTVFERAMPNFQSDNPRRKSDLLNPVLDMVEAKIRPESYRSILSDYDFADRAWNMVFGEGRFFYLLGIDDAMRLLQENSTGFLKSNGYLDEVIHHNLLRTWSDQSGIPLDKPISLVRARELSANRPDFFYKCCESLVAFELAFQNSERLAGRVSEYWVYDYMRVVPAVYNIRGFNSEKLRQLRSRVDDFDRKALEACKQTDSALLDDLANGKTVTRSTALQLKYFVDNFCVPVDGQELGEVRSRPGRRGLGIGPASIHELID